VPSVTCVVSSRRFSRLLVGSEFEGRVAVYYRLSEISAIVLLGFLKGHIEGFAYA